MIVILKEFMLNVYLRHIWKDHRLAYSEFLPGVSVISLPEEMIGMKQKTHYLITSRLAVKVIEYVPSVCVSVGGL